MPYERLSVFDLDLAMLKVIRTSTNRLLREEHCPDEVRSRGALESLDPQLENCGAAIGSWIGSGSPELVVVGICQGSGQAPEKQYWLASGPSIEAVCNIDAAYAMASGIPGCGLQIWIVDQEYANIVADSEKFSSCAKLEIAVGESLATWCQNRYPRADVCRTSNPDIRARLYSFLTRGELASLYPRGVTAPYGNHGQIFWQELQYMVTVALFAITAITESRHVMAVADHEQLRALAAAKLLAGDKFSACALWPCPRLGWIPPQRKPDESSTRYAGRFLNAIKKNKRRMYRGSGPMETLFYENSRSDVMERMKQISPCLSTVNELLRFLGYPGSCESDDPAEAGNSLTEALEFARKGPIKPSKDARHFRRQVRVPAQ
jgi:hypothetical protein